MVVFDLVLILRIQEFSNSGLLGMSGISAGSCARIDYGEAKNRS